jgi:alkylhydroperoxidase/carboxymuconolactone decarboxylase family protein YurZ
MVQGFVQASAPDKKTAFLAVLVALRLESGIPFHVQVAKQRGVTREDVISAILTGLPAAGRDAILAGSDTGFQYRLSAQWIN